MTQCAIIIILGVVLICLGINRAITIQRSQIISKALNTITLKDSSGSLSSSSVEELIKGAATSGSGTASALKWADATSSYTAIPSSVRSANAPTFIYPASTETAEVGQILIFAYPEEKAWLDKRRAKRAKAASKK